MENLAPPPARNLSRQRSTCFLLESVHVRGSDFVTMLRLIGYPGAQNLKGEDFDWLCEGSEEIQLFFAWLCEVVDQRNTVSNEQLDAYMDLVNSGQPILNSEDLQSICKSGEKLEVELEIEDMRSLQELEVEVKSFHALKIHQLQFRNKLEALTMGLLQKHLTLGQSEKELEKTLNNVKDDISTLNSRFNLTLQEIRTSVQQLGQRYLNQSTDNVFTSSLNLEGFMKLEDTCWRQVEKNAKGILPVKEDELESQNEARKEMEKETERMRTSWASHRIQLSISLGFLNSNVAALAWLEENSGDQVWDHLRLPLLEREVKSLEVEIENLQTETLPTLVYDASLGVCSPAHMAFAHVDQLKLSQVSESQSLAAEAIINKLSRLQLVELGLQLEKRYHQQNELDLRDLKVELAKKTCELGKRMLGQRDRRLSPPCPIALRVCSKDQTGVRLCTMLERPSRHKELLPKYGDLPGQALLYKEELKTMSAIFDDPLPHTSHLENDTEDLHQSMCRGTRNLQLRDMELALTSETLLSTVSQFNHWFLDFFRELERKKLAVQTSYTAQERQLYVHFYQDPALLANIVEDLEQRVNDLNPNQS